MHVMAVVAGQPVTEIPNDLFIPPDALEIWLDSFSGPLDLLLYLIRKQGIDMLDIPMVLITEQYMQYIDTMKTARLELAADYLVMAAILASIKSKLLLPPDPSQEDTLEEDPRMELVKRLQRYELFKQAAETLDALPRYERDIFPVNRPTEPFSAYKLYPNVSLEALGMAMKRLLQQQERIVHHAISREVLSVRERMTVVLERLQEESAVEFTRLLDKREHRMGLVVTLLAILELARQALVLIFQASMGTPIRLQRCHDA